MGAVNQADQAVELVDQVQAEEVVQAVDQEMQAVDPDVQIEEEKSADEAVNLQLDFDSDDMYTCRDCEEYPACDFTEEEPHSDAKRKLA